MGPGGRVSRRADVRHGQVLQERRRRVRERHGVGRTPGGRHDDLLAGRGVHAGVGAVRPADGPRAGRRGPAGGAQRRAAGHDAGARRGGAIRRQLPAAAAESRRRRHRAHVERQRAARRRARQCGAGQRARHHRNAQRGSGDRRDDRRAQLQVRRADVQGRLPRDVRYREPRDRHRDRHHALPERVRVRPRDHPRRPGRRGQARHPGERARRDARQQRHPRHLPDGPGHHHVRLFQLRQGLHAPQQLSRSRLRSRDFRRREFGGAHGRREHRRREQRADEAAAAGKTSRLPSTRSRTSSS